MTDETVINSDFYPFDSLTESKDAAAIMERFRNREFAKEAIRAERERLVEILEEAKSYDAPPEEALAIDIEYIELEAEREITSLDEAAGMIESDIEAVGKKFGRANRKRHELEDALAKIKRLQP